jgi:hypothetical protein
MPRHLALSAVLLCVSHVAAHAPDATKLPPPAARKIDFAKDVQPILQRACVSCHGAAKQRGGLRLDDGTLAGKGGNSGAVLKPRDSAGSRLIHLVAGLDPELKMPPGKDKALSANEIGQLRAWIDQGAVWPATTPVAGSSTKSSHWSFQPIRRAEVPEVVRREWVRTPIDAFILARLEKEKIAPSPETDRVTLLRRAALDLIGLPPTPAEVETFLADDRPDAYERAVDLLLASPHYGERWGRHWLDLARYADSDGFEKDTGRPFAWRYRHWVIAALNRDLSYDRFTIEQLAGDLLPSATTEQKVATGFHRNTLTNREGGVDPEQFRVEAIVDRVNTTARVFLGLTLGCAQCHDHKYDPLLQREYYQLFAYFNSDLEANIPAPVFGHPRMDQSLPALGKKPAKSSGVVHAQTMARGPFRPTHVMIRGDFLRRGIAVSAGTPAVLPPVNSKIASRLTLANWIVDRNNPLTARVAVNWVWHKYFGRGLVATLEDFGTQGERPSHTELLDWLADEFVRRRWSIKELHRLIVTSAVYRQSSKARPELHTRDPYNALLARQMRHRLEAEIVRDVILAASGLLVRTVGGPSVRPPQPAGISELTYAGSARWVESAGADRYRRGLYTWFQRTSPYPMLMTFDAPDTNTCCVRRERSNTPLQALTMLNDTVFVECAQALARRVLTESKRDTTERLRLAFRSCTARSPTATELARLKRLYDELHDSCAADVPAAKALVGEPGALATGVRASESSMAEAAAWVALARVLLNLDEVVTRE